VDKFFKTLASLASCSIFSLTKSENGLASGFVFLLANPEFYLHLASWRVVTRTPVIEYCSHYISTICFLYSGVQSLVRVATYEADIIERLAQMAESLGSEVSGPCFFFLTL
jgi:hypothetical protein